MYDFLNNAIYPNFRKFTDRDFIPYYNIYIKWFAPYADISPVNLLSWFDIDGSLEISRLDDAVILCYDNPFENLTKNYIILEPKVSIAHIDAIYSLGTEAVPVSLKEQPATLYQDIPDNSPFIFTENRDSFEYIFSTYEQSVLHGNSFSRQRRRIGLYERQHERSLIEVNYRETVAAQDKALMINIINSWKLTAEVTDDRENREFEALLQAIQTSDLFIERKCLFLYINGKAVAFSLFSLYGDTANVAHIKVDYTIKYTFDYVTYLLARELNKRNIDFMNFEQDLGIPGLRDHKTRMRPVKMLKKIDITRRV